MLKTMCSSLDWCSIIGQLRLVLCGYTFIYVYTVCIGHVYTVVNLSFCRIWTVNGKLPRLTIPSVRKLQVCVIILIKYLGLLLELVCLQC